MVVGEGREGICSSTLLEAGNEAELSEPLPCIHILGRSAMERMIERFLRAEAEAVSVLVRAPASGRKAFSEGFENVECEVVTDVRSAIGNKLKEYWRRGIEHTLVASANVYAETDVLDLFYFHREGRQAATRAFDREGPLDLWVVDCAQAQQTDVDHLLVGAEGTGAAYFIREYVNRLNHPRDLRRMVSDALRGRCAMRPSGREVKPGIWIDEGAEIHRRARIVAPAYVGRESKLLEDTLITRCSNIEEGCYVDYGTVIEDSSILENTHIGIWLDVCLAVAEGNKLVSLRRGAVLEISDPSVMRSTVRREEVRRGAEARDGLGLSRPEEGKTPVAVKREKELPAPETCSFQPILSRSE